MACYRLVWKSSAEKELRKLPREVISRLVELAETLVVNPFPLGARKLVGTANAYRVRAGDYRLIYEVCGTELIIQIIRVGHRREIYR
ncbi:MAG: type II toxin-antitoxin system RelE/ParE family toxin [Methylococcaceae bacterium]|nr:MAG: type II toxin-antitoxin system RelE/ParE family toxin [Methylococcaceae bacterium]